MPSSNPSSTPSIPHGSILLVEEYDGIAAALASALKKFAPDHWVETATSLAQANARLNVLCPDLIIVDFDPPLPGITDFLLQAGKACPDCTAIVIGGGIPAELASDYRRFGTIHFLAKPFEIADLGAAVQALLGPGAQSRPTLDSLGPSDHILVHCAGKRSTTLKVTANGTRAGEVHINEGQIVHARTGRRKDAAALVEMFEWKTPQVKEDEFDETIRRTIRHDWSEIFLEAITEAKPRRTTRTVRASRSPASAPAETPAPPAPAAPPPPPPKTGKKIVIVDDTEMLLVFVEDTLTMADPQLQISTAPNGITGIKEIETLQPDLVLLDFSLPDINGDEVCRRLAANERTARIPIVMMSGHIAEMTATAEAYPNVVATIAKPFMSEALASLVQQTLRSGIRPTPKPAPAKSPAPTPPPKQVPPASAARPSPPPAPPPATKAKTTSSVPPPPPPVIVPPPKPIAAPPPKLAPPTQVRPAPPAPPVATVPVPKPSLPREPIAVALVPAPIVAPPPPVRQSTLPPLPSPIVVTPPAPLPPQERPTAPMEPHVRLKPTLAAPVLATAGSEVVLGLFLEVVSMRLTPSLRMGAIRARPSSYTVSLHVSPAALRGLPVETGFELGAVELNPAGQMSTVRLIPTLQAFQRLPTRSALQIGALNVVPQDSREHVQLTPSPNAPMTMHLLAHLELAGVELSNSFQLAQLVLKCRSTTVRVTLSSEAVGQEQTGVFCESAAVRLDQSGRIAEMLLKPLK